jgi:hypothetical protein
VSQVTDAFGRLSLSPGLSPGLSRLASRAGLASRRLPGERPS